MREPLQREALHEALVTSDSPWQDVDVRAEVGSTNAEVARAGRPWHVVVADHQSAGRGRLGRTWEDTPRTSIAVSALLPAPDSGVGWMPLVTGLAVSRAVAEVAGVDAAVKWPNDVLVAEDDWRKVCGVLCEVHPAGVVVGFGVNVDQTREELPVDTATSLRLCGAEEVRREDLVVACLRHLAALHADLVAGGARREGVRAAYRAACRTLGLLVDVTAGDRTSRVRAVGVDDEGRLVVRGESGEYAVAAGDVVHVRTAG
ncbi:MAG TPA: biotin--[acetyl-CoA-carboxylase] ligase [Pedococcus sp.]|jgi:BirA family biotin operon repressor/biotin-[acetyl-CoA-carboxylase] ligase